MRLRRISLAAAVLLAALAAPARALKTETMDAALPAGGRRPIPVVSGQASVRFAAGTTSPQIEAALAAAGASRAGDLGGGWLSVTWKDGTPVAVKLKSLQALPGAAAAEPSKAYRALLTPNDPLFGSQYALSQVSAPAGWEYETGTSSRVTIVVVDAGIDGTQPDLRGKLANTRSQVFDQGSGAGAPDNPPTPACDHATHVAGVAAASADNGVEVAGMSWGAQLVSYKVFTDASCNVDCSDSSPSDSCSASDASIAGALNAAALLQNTEAYGRIVVNMSLGAPATPCSSVLQNAITAAYDAGVVIVAAAGNDGGAVNSPGNCLNVIPMGATDVTGAIASFSSSGPELASFGLVAPGVSVLTTDLNGGTVEATGTSFASPMGAGLASLILSASPRMTPAQVQANMRAGAQSVGASSAAQGAGQMNAYRSLRLTVKGTLAGFDGDQKPVAFPNPFRLSAESSVNFSIPTSLQGSGTDIKIYTLQGGFVRELGEPFWDGKNANGNLVASGTYVFLVTTSAGSARGRMAVIR
ncbi:MAG: S8 family peptidase [Elusimicrobiota bacterium]